MYKNINPLKKIFDLSPLILKNIFATFYSVLISRKKYGKKYYGPFEEIRIIWDTQEAFF